MKRLRMLSIAAVLVCASIPAMADSSVSDNPVLLPAVSTYPMDQEWETEGFAWRPAELADYATGVLRDSLKNEGVKTKNWPMRSRDGRVPLMSRDQLLASARRYGAPFYLEVQLTDIELKDKSGLLRKMARVGGDLVGKVTGKSKKTETAIAEEAIDLALKHKIKVNLTVRLVNAIEDTEVASFRKTLASNFQSPPIGSLTDLEAEKLLGNGLRALARKIAKQIPPAPVRWKTEVAAAEPNRRAAEALVSSVRVDSKGIKYGYIDIGSDDGVLVSDRFELFEVEYEIVAGRFDGKTERPRGTVAIVAQPGTSSTKIALDSGEELEDFWEVRLILDAPEPDTVEASALEARLTVEYGVDDEDIRERRIDAGSADGVEVGHRFSVLGVNGDEPIGLIEVVDVGQETSVVELMDGSASTDGARVQRIIAGANDTADPA